MDTRIIPVDSIIPLKAFDPAEKRSSKYRQITASMKSVGIVENVVVVPNRQGRGTYLLLDGLMRLEVAKDLGWKELECLIATDDESYTYNKRVNRLAAVQEHKMIVRAMDRGLSAVRIAHALNLAVDSVRRRFRLLDGICPEAVSALVDQDCPLIVFDLLRRMVPSRQIEAARLMVGQRNFTAPFIRAILVATPEDQLIRHRGSKARPRVTHEHIARMERELIAAQSRARCIEEAYGDDNLQLTIARGYLMKLLGRPRIVDWLSSNRPEYLAEFQEISAFYGSTGSKTSHLRHAASPTSG